MDHEDKQKRTLGQRAFDNIWFLLIIGMAFPGIFYLGWGLLEIFVFNNTQLKDYLAQSNQQYLLPGK
ncbi:hypothetical protein [Turneriella parva]|uniref:Uncharacterized protein n=1 Tax=Turneriella parva (strain ATCC BAA-1111 / DSM 21527 / NCTC 11395 / H) TaxID=869212 RepID=I4B650_TURPD|nr:hypothetical protein [Turneriella parva]AFM12757.1 hypothetical protein Turpa_2111 [Turneriella parva DSM 21527]